MKQVNLASKIKTRIAFVGNFEYNCGSSNALLGYSNAGKKLGHDIRVSKFGYADTTITSSIPVADKNWQADLVIFVYESYQFLSEKDINEICSVIPRSKRIIIDCDGKYLPSQSYLHDTNHLTPNLFRRWTTIYDTLSDIILQPLLGRPHVNKIHNFLFYGMAENTIPVFQKKDFDVLYLGNNWYRWQDIQSFVQLLAPIRSTLKRIALIGRWWTDEILTDFQEATYSDQVFLKKNTIEIFQPPSYGQVEMEMSRGFLHPIFIRPILNHFKFVTPRMFETFAADTIPILPHYFTYAFDLYNAEIEQLMFLENPAEAILRILHEYNKYHLIKKNIENMLRQHHSYEVRLQELLQFI